ncbi:helix-turn-helix domain-containing protein [Nocardioides sp. W7]|uniref:helix-turn-helix domain-containing protein n=1 Tax=Nocardioides sp. W7 TaxID=2931390 RepID=UPI0024684FB4|nr:helix-turn-helix domain-containing protein [Nocardioides sp. W7]
MSTLTTTRTGTWKPRQSPRRGLHGLSQHFTVRQPTSAAAASTCLGGAGRVAPGGRAIRTLSRLFRSDLGMTFPQWRTQLRLRRALILLAEHTPVTAVAHQCGCASTSAFIDVFRRTFRHTPGAHMAPA